MGQRFNPYPTTSTAAVAHPVAATTLLDTGPYKVKHLKTSPKKKMVGRYNNNQVKLPNPTGTDLGHFPASGRLDAPKHSLA